MKEEYYIGNEKVSKSIYDQFQDLKACNKELMIVLNNALKENNLLVESLIVRGSGKE